MFDLSFEPLIPMSLWLALAVGAAVVLGWYALRRPTAMARHRWVGSLCLMTVGLVAILALLLNPTWSRTLAPPPGKPIVTLLIDSSASMATADASEGATRFQAAAQVASDLAKELGNDFEVRTRTFDRQLKTADASKIEIDPDGASTDVAGAITASLSEESAAGQAIVLLSDGIHNSGGGSGRVLDSVRVAKAIDAPIYTRVFGGDVRRVDVAVEIRSPQDLAIVGQHLPLTARVSQTGLGGGNVNVVLTENGKEIARRSARLPPTGTVDVHFMVTHDAVGVFPYEIHVEPIAGEVSQANNSAPYVLRVVNEPIRILVLEGKPYWDSKFFTRTLVTDPAVALDSVVKLTDARLMRRVLTHKKSDPATAAPVAGDKSDTPREETWQIAGDPASILAGRDKLNGYQVIVLGRDAETFLTDQAVANLQDWISEDGGSLVCYRGSPTSVTNQKLSRVLPVRWSPEPEPASRYRLALTDRGEDMDWFRKQVDGVEATQSLSGMPSLASGAHVDSSKPLAVVLASSVAAGSTENPVVVYQPYGSGRVVVIEGAGMWRWAFLAPQYQQSELVYASLWHSLVRWLTSGESLKPGQQFSLRTDKIRFGVNEPATVTLLARQEGGAESLPKIELATEPSSSTDGSKSFAPVPVGGETGVFRVNFGQLPEGRYRASLAGAKENETATRIVFDVRKFDQEQLDVEARPDLMARIATDSGGATLTAATTKDLAKMFKDHHAKSHPPQIERTTAWDRWWVLAIIFGIWTASWFVRRSGGLI